MRLRVLKMTRRWKIDKTSRRSIPYFPASRSERELQGHAFLLARDIPLGIMPFRSGREEGEFKVDLPGAAEGDLEWLADLFDIDEGRRWSAEDVVSNFVEEASNYIAYFGEIYCEILRESERFQLAVMPAGKMGRLPGYLVQWVPRADQKQVGKRYVLIDRSRMFHIALPQELGTPRSHRQLLSQLSRVSKSVPDFAFQGLDLGRSKGYEFSVHRAAADRYLELLTRRWGSVPSLQRPIEGSSEYFYISRRLAFHRAQALLREQIIDGMNALLERLQRNFRIAVKGLPTADDLDQALVRLHEGRLSFAEALQSWRT